LTSIGGGVILKETVKKSVSAKLRRGFAPLLLLLGIVAVLLLLGMTIFGPWELPGFGQLSQRQEGQEASAAEIAFPGPDDADKDGFTDSVEKWIKTDPADNCADDANDAAWPPDINNDKKVNQADIDAFKPHMLKRVNDSNRRFDLNADKKINVVDVLTLSPFMGASCPFYFLKATPGVQSVTFNWTPALETPNTIKVVDLTAYGKTESDCVQEAVKGLGKTIIPGADPGATSFTWTTSTDIKPISGHKYCSALSSYPTNIITSAAVSFTVPFPPPPPPPPTNNTIVP